MAVGLHDVDDRPAQQPKYFPIADRIGIDGLAAGRAIGLEQGLAPGEPADRKLVLPEAPGACAKPTHILDAGADMAAFPVEHGGEAVRSNHEIAVAEVAMDKGTARRRRTVALQPAEAQLDRGMKLGIGLVMRTLGRDRILAVGDWIEKSELGRIDRTQPGKEFAELRRQLRSDIGEGGT